MRYLYSILILLFSVSLASADEGRFRFSYDDQGVPEYAIRSVEVFVNGTLECNDDTPVIDANGEYNFSCSAGFTAPVGDIEVYMVVVTANGLRLPTTIAMGTMPPVPTPLPDPTNPVFESGEIERSEDGYILTLEVTTNQA